MSIRESYNHWASQYDTNENPTRDLEARALRTVLNGYTFENCLEIGCGTGKNTEWLIGQAKEVLAVDLSEEMLALARQKVPSEQVQFIRADINQSWEFARGRKFSLVTFSLVLEHIENLEPVFEKLSEVVAPGGYVYIGELHPFKQYNGSKARFETTEGTHIVSCFNHHISDFLLPAKKYGFQPEELNEYFDDEQHRSGIPRILALLFRKEKSS